MDDLNRRDFLKIGSAALAAVNIEASPAARPQESGCRITAVCDIRPERTDWATRQVIDRTSRADRLHARLASASHPSRR